jgi:hypothetical protein
MCPIGQPSYIKNKDSVSDITEFKVKCEGFCKKNKQVLCDDLSLYREIIDTNVKEDLSNYETVELKKLTYWCTKFKVFTNNLIFIS